MTPKAALVVAGAGLLAGLGCRSAGIDGGYTESPKLRTGARVAEYALAECRDGDGHAVEPPRVQVSRVRLETGRDVFVEERPGYDALVLERARREDPAWVFTLTLGDGTQDRVLHELRIPDGPRSGRFRIADGVDGEAADPDAPLPAAAVALDCALVPGDPGARLDTRDGLE